MLNLIHAIAAEPLVIARKSVLVRDDEWFIHFCTHNTMTKPVIILIQLVGLLQKISLQQIRFRARKLGLKTYEPSAHPTHLHIPLYTTHWRRTSLGTS
jgi:hypothetical protein